MQTAKKKVRKQLPGLKSEILRKVKADPQIVAKIITSTGKSYPTIMLWLKKNSERLTQAKCLEVICNELQLRPDQVLAA